MRRFPDTPRKRSRIEIIPMIDVMMFLLVFFVLISTNVIPAQGLKTRLPVSSQSRDDRPPTRVVVTITREGALQIDGADVADPESLEARLRARRTEAGDRLVVVVNGDQDVPLQRLVSVMDRIKASGIESMMLATKGR